MRAIKSPQKYNILIKYANKERRTTMKYFTNIRTLDELKAAYRRLALKYHPDMGGSTEIISSSYSGIALMYSRSSRGISA